ncbi:hypothetical protein [Streptomyces mangrovisoli]|uniref:Uncharacterized protein n=1 Tax=Streptomyces mangrovisoli TaxID=1428628 RepID=A0A1J4P3X3_9ACTN|nr:hypothetical protein [Streptomyces mangrovisoli]OIJ68158.1 hypothetical protein WN71_010030 [Streptomyces mangrovisoli]
MAHEETQPKTKTQSETPTKARETDFDARRRARFSRLPEPVRLADTVEERPATAPDPARDTYNPDEWLVRYAL